jgi:alkylation response protein AidB-like acyl-CoA dehydrogenase
VNGRDDHATARTAVPGEQELRLLRESLREAFSRLSPPAEVRRQMATGRGWDTQVWRRLCRELDVVGLMVPEELGGSGFSAAALGVVFEEAGRALLCAPLLATAGLAVPLLLALDDPAAAKRYLPALCEGAQVATVVTADVDGRQLPDGDLISVTGGDAGPVLDGTAGFVVDGACADLLLVPARADGVVGVYAVEASSPGVVATPLVTLDQTRKQARVEFTAAPAVRIGPDDASGALACALDVARALLAAEQAGGAAACLDAAVSYAKTRIQFGRPIGSFQAIKQKAADLLIQVESARSAAHAAAQAAASALSPSDQAAPPGVPGLAVTALVAKIYCSDAYLAVAAENIQLHGGIGFTWEHDAHLYFKRAWTSRELLGGPEEHTERLARLLEGDIS